MPFSIPSGIYTPPSGAENAVPGEVIRSATWNTIFTDLSTALTQVGQAQVPSPQSLQATLGLSRVLLMTRGVNFSAGSLDTPISVVLPTGFTEYQIINGRVLHATGTLTTATFGIFSGPAASGTTLVANNTSTTITGIGPGIANNMQNLTFVNTSATEYINTPTLYLRVQTAQPGTVFANVATEILVLS